jgi:asparagine synthase (glutamine-hydrolysing)
MKQISKYFSLIKNNNKLSLTIQSIDRFIPSYFLEIGLNKYDLEQLTNLDNSINFKKYYNLPYNTTSIYYKHKVSLEKLYNALVLSVKKRVDTTDRPVCCLLSGGLDSSLIAALVAKFELQKGNQIETYSIGMPGSEDLKHARIVSNWIGSKHNEIHVTAEEMFNSIPDVIYSIESFDTTTVRASVGNYLVSKYISNHSNAKVVFNGDGADEVMGGYLYFHKITDPIVFDQECRRLVSEIYHYDVLRSDKSISSNGLEPRTPFLDEAFVRAYFDLPAYMRCHTINNVQEKYLIRELVNNFLPDLLPNEVLYRTKEAFSDGVSGDTKSWYEEIQDRVKQLNIQLNKDSSDSVEDTYYKQVFSSFFNREFESKHYKKMLETRWMPRFIDDATDPSARTLKIYSALQKQKSNKNIEDIRKESMISALNSYLTFNLSN